MLVYLQAERELVYLQAERHGLSAATCMRSHAGRGSMLWCHVSLVNDMEFRTVCNLTILHNYTGTIIKWIVVIIMGWSASAKASRPQHRRVPGVG